MFANVHFGCKKGICGNTVNDAENVGRQRGERREIGMAGGAGNWHLRESHEGWKRDARTSAPARRQSRSPRERGMPQAVGLLDSISEFCRRAGMAESTFGRRAVNDGKFVARLRDGARITPETLERVSEFLITQGVEAPASPRELMQLMRVAPAPAGPAQRAPARDAPSRNFRFFDNRQKYLLFVNTCGEKETVAKRVGMELAHIHPRPPAIRVFDAGMGDGSVLSRVMREMHRRFPTRPFY